MVQWPAVVGSRRDLVDDEAGSGVEQLDAHDPHKLESVGDGSEPWLVPRCSWVANRGGNHGGVEYVVDVAVFHHTVVDDIAVERSSHHHRQLAFERHHRFDHQPLTAEGGPRVADRVGVIDPDLALSVVTEPGHLGDHRRSEIR